MIYQINENYYVKVGNKFVKVSFSFDEHDELIMTPVNSEKIENNQKLNVRETTFDSEKTKIAESLKKKKSFEKEKSFESSFGKGKRLS